MSEETIPVAEVRHVINQRMSYHESEMKRWKDTLEARRNESDHALNAKLEIDIACHQSVWCILLALAGDLKIKLDEEAR